MSTKDLQVKPAFSGPGSNEPGQKDERVDEAVYNAVYAQLEATFPEIVDFSSAVSGLTEYFGNCSATIQAKLNGLAMLSPTFNRSGSLCFSLVPIKDEELSDEEISLIGAQKCLINRTTESYAREIHSSSSSKFSPFPCLFF